MFSMKHLIATVALGLFSFAGQSFAVDKAEVLKKTPALASVMASGAKVLTTFEGPSGLTGYAVEARGEQHILYATPDGQHLLLGVLMDADGRNISAQHHETYMPKADYTAAYEKLEKSLWIADGAIGSKSVAYVFLEPNCVYCHYYWKALKPYMAAGLEVRWVPVAFLREDSMAKAAQMVEAEDSVATIEQHERNFKAGGIQGTTFPSADTVQAIERNNALMRDFGVAGTPATVIKTAQGQVQIIKGMPSLNELPSMFNLPEQEITDPELARFQR